jgi:hypothetical protein
VSEYSIGPKTTAKTNRLQQETKNSVGGDRGGRAAGWRHGAAARAAQRPQSDLAMASAEACSGAAASGRAHDSLGWSSQRGSGLGRSSQRGRAGQCKEGDLPYMERLPSRILIGVSIILVVVGPISHSTILKGRTSGHGNQCSPCAQCPHKPYSKNRSQGR